MSAPRAMSRQTTARLASREIGGASIKSPKLTACAPACATARSANAVSTGALLSGSNRFALSSCRHRMPRSVAILKRAPLQCAQFRAAAKPGQKRSQPARRSAWHLISTMSQWSSPESTRKSGVYRRRCPSCSKWIVTGCAVTTALASMKLASVTKSHSRALSCSAIPVESLEPGHMRPSTKWNAAQFVLHSENGSVRNPLTFSRQFTNLRHTYARK